MAEAIKNEPINATSAKDGLSDITTALIANPMFREYAAPTVLLNANVDRFIRDTLDKFNDVDANGNSTINVGELVASRGFSASLNYAMPLTKLPVEILNAELTKEGVRKLGDNFKAAITTAAGDDGVLSMDDIKDNAALFRTEKLLAGVVDPKTLAKPAGEAAVAK